MRVTNRAQAVALTLTSWVITAAGMPAGGQEPSRSIRFNRDIRPILVENCYQCHGPDKNQRKADLRLDVREVALELGAIEPGNVDESELAARISSDDPDEMMPPPKSRKRLTSAQKRLLKRWIAEGAEYEGHWSYVKPVRPEAPAGSDGLDALVARRLKALGLRPSPEADRRTLARRLSFDLVGLPPTPEQVEAFLKDRAPDAYEKLVDSLLASPHYGERMAIAWLDLVRFADTIGYHSDNPRNIWPYRDYVINSFNGNMPFDRFTVEQLAGDLLPNPTQDQKVASAFNRLLLTTEEGGAQPKDYEARMLGDRVRAVGTVWLGQTLGCCQCHDHKFDPAKARDFYSLGAFFADISEPIIGSREPGMTVPNAEQSDELRRRREAIGSLRSQLESSSPALTLGQEAWEKAVLAELAMADHWTVLKPEKATAERGTRLEFSDNGVVTASRNARGGVDTYRITFKTSQKGITALRLDAMADPALPMKGPGRAGNGNFVLTEVSLVDQASKEIPLAHASATFEQSSFPAYATIDGKSDRNNGWAVMGSTGVDSAIVFETTTPVGNGDPQTLTLTLRQQQGDNHTLGRFRLSAATCAPPVRAPRAVIPAGEILDLIRRKPIDRNPQQASRLATHYRSFAPELNEVRGQLAAAEKGLADFEARLPRCLVSVAMSNPRTVRILPRGNWLDESGEIVKPALPSYIAPEYPSKERLTRLDLARWLVSRENPLTARVFVNRLWKQFFGIGLSKSLDDLGSQGEWPANPELLDWLACEFMDRGWDVKAMVRTIVLSRTYRQSSAATREQLVRDPENRELARQGRYRLDAELVRDNALAIAGLLSESIGGPSAKPYQPEGYWENLNFPPRQYVADTGSREYRRGLYTWWQRSFPHPSMIAFDAPTREECAADRSRSNIPQQALVLLNDPTYVEAARVFAARILAQGGHDDAVRIGWAWRRALQRLPRPDELATVSKLLKRHREQFGRDRQAAEALLKVGLEPAPREADVAELAAWTSVARVILNLHETITRN